MGDLYMKSLYLLLILTIATGNYTSAAEVSEKLGIPPWCPIGQYTHPAIRESSGIVASRQFEGVYWTLNDSGNPAALYATKLNGELIQEISVQDSQNFDWEALGIDDQNQLWIGEIGNNSRLRTDLKVVVIAEPNPFTDIEATVIANYPYQYPSENVDAEGLFVADGVPYIVSKERERATLYRFPTLKTDTQHILERVGEFAEAKWVTGAGLSTDGTRLAVCTYDALWVYHSTAGNFAQMIQGAPWSLHHNFYGEAICFEGYDLVLTNEARDLYRTPQFWYEKEWTLPPKSTYSAVALLADTDEFQAESYHAAGIEIDGGHVTLNAKVPRSALNQQIQAEYRSLYEISTILTRGPEYGQVELSVNGTVIGSPYDCYNPERIPGNLVTFGIAQLEAGNNQIVLSVVGKTPEATGYKIGIDSYQILHTAPYIKSYLVLGPFLKAGISTTDEPIRPEIELDLERTFEGINGKTIHWQEVTTEADGFLDLNKNIGDGDIAAGYTLTHVYAPKATGFVLLLGSDDAITLWLNGTEIHRNDVIRPTIPDQHAILCQMEAGWNTIISKTSRNGGYWGFYLRFADADRVLKYSSHPME